MPVVMQAIRTAFSGGKLLLTAEEATIVRQEFGTKLNAVRRCARAAGSPTGNQKAGAEFLAKNKLRQGRVHDEVRPAVHDPAPGRGHAPEAG